jgi:hypothetical protein
MLLADTLLAFLPLADLLFSTSMMPLRKKKKKIVHKLNRNGQIDRWVSGFLSSEPTNTLPPKKQPQNNNNATISSKKRIE